MTEEEDGPVPQGPAPHDGEDVSPGDGRLQTVIILSVVLWSLAFLAFELQPLFAGLAAAANIGTALYVLAGRVTRERMPLVAADRRAGSIWPDTGMKLVLDALEVPAFLVDARGSVRYQNGAAIAHFGAARAGDPLSFKLRMPAVLDAVARAATGATVEPVRIVERGAAERHLVARVAPIRRPGPKATERPDFLLVELRDETELVRVERMRGDFIANASHELRTPLASLTGFIETLLGPARKDEANRERFLKIMLDQAQRMGRLIDDLLSLSRVEMKAHVRPSTPLDLAGLPKAAVDMLMPLAGQRGITLAVDLGVAAAPVAGDRDELLQVLVNLTENAIKYGREGGEVRIGITAETGPAGDAGYALTVADDGPGIAPEHLPRLTERFYRVDAARSRAEKGTGLGLAIVKHILARHQARLQIRSDLGKGTVVKAWFEAATSHI